MKKRTIASGIFIILFLILIMLVKTVDVAAIGPMGTSIGLSTINQSVHKMIGVHMLWYKITWWLGNGALLLAAVCAAIGLYQLIKRRSLALVDRDLIYMGILFVVTMALYVLFEKVIINYRPMIMPSATEPEASFPSSHTMLVIVIFGAVSILIRRHIENRIITICLCSINIVYIITTVIGRLISGCHWFTDICGGILIAAALLCAFSAVSDDILIVKHNKEVDPSKDIINEI